MMVVGYPTPGKGKAVQLVSAFCRGAGGMVVDSIPSKLLPGAAVFYGVTAATVHLWEQAKDEGRDWIYLDNAYFDSCRERYFRATKNRLQHTGLGESDGERFRSLGIEIKPWRNEWKHILEIKPWRNEGKHILVCPQSDEFMRVVAKYPGSWVEDTMREMRRKFPGHELRVRPWARDKAQWYATLPADLKDCHMLVAYSSASAITAIMSGIPAGVAPNGESICLGLSPWEEDRTRWAGVIADNQWTLEEMRSGLCWDMLQEVALA